MGESNQNTVDGSITLEQTRWESYIRTQWMGELLQNTVYYTLGHSRQDSYFRTHYMGQLLQNTEDGTVTLGQSRCDDYI